MQKLPRRVQRKRTKGFKLPQNTVYIGRPTKFGNPYTIGKMSSDFRFPATRKQAVGFYKQWILSYGVQTHFIDEVIRELKGKNLACYCPVGQPCHGDVLLQIANV